MSDVLTPDELDALLAEVGKSEQSEGEKEEAGEPLEAAPDQEPAETPEESERPADDDGVGAPNLRLILSLPVNLNVELGRTHMSLHEILQLGQGSVVELDRMASDLIDLSVNGKVIAQGEAVVVNENFGFRVTEVESVRERIRKL